MITCCQKKGEETSFHAGVRVRPWLKERILKIRLFMGFYSDEVTHREEWFFITQYMRKPFQKTSIQFSRSVVSDSL